DTGDSLQEIRDGERARREQGVARPIHPPADPELRRTLRVRERRLDAVGANALASNGVHPEQAVPHRVGASSQTRFDGVRRQWHLRPDRVDHLRAERRGVRNGPGQQAEADDQQCTVQRTVQRARPRTNSTNVPTGTPVGPRGTVPRSDSVYAVPAMSRCTHGYPSANSFKNSAAVIVPAGRPPEFLISATSDLINSLYSSQSGSGHPGSPDRLPASSTSCTNASSVPMTPVAVCPSAMTHAPVRVAASTTADGEKRFAYVNTSASTRRPSASVLMISMYLPFEAWTTSPGFTASPDGMFVVEPMRPTTLMGSSNRPIASIAPRTPAAPHMSNFIHSMPCAGLIEMPPESKQSPFPTSATGCALAAPLRYSMAMSFGSCDVPCATERNDPIFSACISARPSTVIFMPK